MAAGGEAGGEVDADLLELLTECRLERRNCDMARQRLGSLEALFEQLEIRGADALASDFESNCAWTRIDMEKFRKLCSMVKGKFQKRAVETSSHLAM
eukprot:2197564-Rhodomonas_salina.2